MPLANKCLPPAVNFHINRACDASCRFCFATFEDVRRQLRAADALLLLDALGVAGARKVNFAGGEPTLHTHLGAYLRRARSLGLTTSIVTNGSRLAEILETHGEALDWVGLSVDSADEAVEVAVGRSRGGHVARAVELADRCRRVGVRVKLNTVVSRLNWEEDLTVLVRRIAPARWKVFQVLPVAGQNDGRVEPLLITPHQFRAFVARHAGLAPEGFAPISEDNDAMRGSYAMIDPLGRFFSNASGRHEYGPPILEVGVERAFREVAFSGEAFDARGGSYAW